jgi:hypothetical protein
MPKGATTDETAPTRPARTLFLWLGVLLVVGAGVVAVVAWFAVYPQPETPISVPVSPGLAIYTSEPVGQVTYLVTTDSAGLPEMRITVRLGLALIGSSSVVNLPRPTQGASLEVTLPAPLAFRDCDRACTNYADEVAWVKPLDFPPGQATVTDVFPIETPDFGTDVGRVYAYAAIPEVSFMSLPSMQKQAAGNKVLLPVLRAEYPIPTALSYDWSPGLEPTVTGSMAIWQEILAAGNTPGQTASGVDHGRQTHDAEFTFWAGLLIGLAGSLLLAGFQLLLPSPTGSGTDRNDAGAASAPE